MGGDGSVERRKYLSSGWTLLEWGVNNGFSITMHSHEVRLRKTTCWIPYSETTGRHISISWYQTIPWGGIEAQGQSGQLVEYTYSP